MVAATLEVSTSLWTTWPISCPITASSSAGVSVWSMLEVATTTAFCGPRPVAKALG